MADTHLNAFESELFELFDKYHLDPEVAAEECLFVANDILTQMGNDSVEALRKVREQVDELDATVSSEMIFVGDGEDQRLVTLKCEHWRTAQDVPRWRRLDEMYPSKVDSDLDDLTALAERP